MRGLPAMPLRRTFRQHPPNSHTGFFGGGIMSVTAKILFLLATGACCAGVAVAAGDLTQQTPIVIKVQLGDEKNKLRFVPDSIELETGKLYRLILSNPSVEKHYFSSEGLAQAVFTRKVQVNGAGGKPSVEVKGAIREIEVYPNAVSEWWFVPIKTGTFGDLKCTIPGQAEAGMIGRILIK
jgi:uncharacterized cupredoxin-like copper-binding protein